ncbi:MULTISPECIES: non-ribosomal peptide synthetase [unclassified Paraburkholderia]|uniref:non-ribosomal peptide synthetase n=1 Tax=unclassified Paraburkholderia TaxID=2615204 RepID=UPI002AAFC52B|nr:MULTISPECIES: non-ribosomal peptide synthetase [unclassified Paraburkholderia]
MTRDNNEYLEIARSYAALPADKRARFKARLREHGIDGSILPVVPLAQRPARLPLSWAQERLWFLWRLEPDGHAYNIARALRIDGALDDAALDAALAALIARHAVLRTVFGETGGVAWQEARAPGAGPQARRLDLRDATSDLHATLLDNAARPFDLESETPLRVSVLRTGDASYVVQIVIHHIASDAWSMGILIREFTTLYAQARAGAKLDATPPELQYADVALWQREWVDSARLDKQAAYWTAQLAGSAPVLALPADRPRPAVRDARGARHAFDIDASVAAALNGLSRQHDATLFMTLLNAFNLLLYRYCGETDLWVGVPVAGRQCEETHALMGLFVNTLVIRSRVSAAQSAAQHLRTLRDTVLAAQSNDDLPFAQLLDLLKTERDLSHAPLFQTLFNLDRADAATQPDLDGLRVTPLDSDAGAVRFDLTLNVIDSPQGLRAIFNYASDMFDAATIERLARDYAGVLAQFAADPARRPGDFALEEPAAGSQALAHYAFEAVAPRFAARAALQPDAPAVLGDDATLSYGQLDAWSNRIGRQLKRAGVRQEVRVGVCLARSVALPAALLAVWKAGGAYVPLDPDYPAARLRDMVEDAGIGAVVIDTASRAQVGTLFDGLTQIDVAQVHAEDAQGWDEPVHPQQLAYVLYTSGSTGRAKGVALDHEALSLHLRDFADAYRIGAQDTMLQSSTINFDVALHELLPALLAGGQVRMRGPQPWTLDSLSAALAQARVTFARIPTALWQQWQRNLPAPRTLAALRQITVGGEALPADALAHWQRGPLRHVALDNLYGPTETAIAALHYPTGEADADESVVPIGRPYPGRGALVLDADGNPMPQGGAGELCITGPCVARGYPGRAALTAERFVPDPHGRPGARLYRSGDLCRVREDGVIQFLGRLDQQVKLRGQRIELGEIEAALRACDGVREAAVVLERRGEQARLVAYVVAAVIGDENFDALRAALAERLPAFMVPACFVALAALPVMANGKLDRRALPAAPDDTASHEADQIAPRTPRERTLRDIWQQVLGREIGSVTTNFFAAGGDSILSLQLLARAKEAGLALTPKEIFAHPTIAELALVARDSSAEHRTEAAERHDAQPLTPIQAGFFEKHPAGLAHWNQAVLLSAREALDPVRLDAALCALVARHDALRLRFGRDAQSRGWHQRIAPQEDAALLRSVALDPHDWQTQMADAGLALHRSLDLENGPLLRAASFEAGEARRLLIVVHHLAVDGVSWRVLLEELQALYERPEAALPALTTPWSVWVARQPEYAQQSERLWQLAWWQRNLHGASAHVPLAGPDDGAGEIDRRVSASRVASVRLSAQATQRLVERGGAEERLLAALAQTLGPWSGAPRLLIDLEGHGREDLIDGVDLSRTVGWFTTQYPLAFGWHDDPARALAAVRETLRAVPDKGFAWGALRRFGDAASRAAMAALPVPALRFNYLGRFDQALPSDGPFGFASERSGAQSDDADTMDHVLDIGALIVDGQLRVNLRYSPGVLAEATVTALAARYERALEALIDIDDDTPFAAHVAPVPPAPVAAGASAALTEAEQRDRAVFDLWMQRARLEVMLGALAGPNRAGNADIEDSRDSRFGPLPAGIVALNDLRAPRAVFCIHAGHGLVAEYRSLAKALNGRATLFGLQAPLLADAQWQAQSFDDLAADYMARIRAVQPEGPYRLLGWSFGGRVVTALVEQFERAGQQVELAGLIDALPDRDADDDVEAEVRALRKWIAQHAANGVHRAERALFERACDVILEHGRLADTFRMPRLSTPLTVWWSTESVQSGKPRDWPARTGTRETVLAEIPAGHTSIMHHPMLVDSLLALLD